VCASLYVCVGSGVCVFGSARDFLSGDKCRS
jgi:hypothetical protein